MRRSTVQSLSIQLSVPWLMFHLLCLGYVSVFGWINRYFTEVLEFIFTLKCLIQQVPIILLCELICLQSHYVPIIYETIKFQQNLAHLNFSLGATAFGTMTLSISTLNIKTFSITTLSIKTFSIMTFSIMTFSIMTFST